VEGKVWKEKWGRKSVEVKVWKEKWGSKRVESMCDGRLRAHAL
jgi:hypothetical protein